MVAAPRRAPGTAPRFPGATLEIDAAGEIVQAWLGPAAPALDPHRDVLAALGIDDTTPDAARVQLVLASTIGAPAAAWPILAADAPTTLQRRDGRVLAVLWEPVIAGDVIAGAALFVAPGTTAPCELEDPVEINRICVDALALLDECDASLRHLRSDRRARHAVHRMFRAVHTIKGSTRGTRLQPVADLAHHAEEAIEVLQSADEAAPQLLQRIGDSLRQLRTAVATARPRGEVDDAMTEGDRQAAASASPAIAAIRGASERANMQGLRAQCVTAAGVIELIASGATLDPMLLDELAILDQQIELYASVYREASASDIGPSLLVTMAAAMDSTDDHSGTSAGVAELITQAGTPSLIQALGDRDPLTVRCSVALLMDAGAMFEPGRPRDDATLQLERAQRDLVGALDGLARAMPQASLGTLRAIVQRLVWVPLAGVARRLARMTRTLGSELGKTIAAEIELGDVLVAPEIARAVGDLLIHAVRNAADHGIEGPAERTAAGKDPNGTIAIAAYALDDRVLVTVRDDGRGVAFGKVRRIAVDRGLLSEAAAAAAHDSQLLDLLFHPGFSTAPAVTAISGRGVGMDVIRSLASELGGRVSLVSQPGAGTELTIDLPLTPPPATAPPAATSAMRITRAICRIPMVPRRAP